MDTYASHSTAVDPARSSGHGVISPIAQDAELDRRSHEVVKVPVTQRYCIDTCFEEGHRCSTDFLKCIHSVVICSLGIVSNVDLIA